MYGQTQSLQRDVAMFIIQKRWLSKSSPPPIVQEYIDLEEKLSSEQALLQGNTYSVDGVIIRSDSACKQDVVDVILRQAHQKQRYARSVQKLRRNGRRKNPTTLDIEQLEDGSVDELVAMRRCRAKRAKQASYRYCKAGRTAVTGRLSLGLLKRKITMAWQAVLQYYLRLVIMHRITGEGNLMCNMRSRESESLLKLRYEEAVKHMLYHQYDNQDDVLHIYINHPERDAWHGHVVASIDGELRYFRPYGGRRGPHNYLHQGNSPRARGFLYAV